ncbi:4-aminobutyrate--2-oxoglutarate transaminase [Natroniella acetigena]|uniref:4-aminobutyrate--2-oxoglutarate transaminase n=1 Tax=Natroniella acetigena TaxID=52004 RepID=UPI002009E3BA|nr:4-aminobutyrate--2-oxoglutarate transaminase [Natroniella acetigena]MCK8827656.1 4-aminobutyrate--2-oxoglutarate transaminase [Natroniella acetigena]
MKKNEKTIKLKTELPGPEGQKLMKERKEYIPRGVYNLAPIVAKRAEGSMLEDVDGNKYLDFAGGIGVLNVGHNAPEVVEAIKKQAEELIHTCFHVAAYEPYIELAKRLSDLAPGSTSKKTMFANSGAEAVENAVKIARKHTGKSAIISFDYGFHGRTLMTMSLTSKVKPYKFGFGPFAPEVYKAPYAYCYRCPFGLERSECNMKCVDNFAEIFKRDIPAEDVAAIVVEPLQGEGGFIAPPKEFLQGVKKICEENDILFIVDEVQTGFARTGNLFAIDDCGIEADIIATAKSIAGGMPLSAVIGKEEIMDAPQGGEIGGTYGGNPVSCAAALAVLDIIERDNLVERANELGGLMKARLEEMQDKYSIIGDVRGKGFMLAIELVKDRETKEPAAEEKSKIAEECYKKGLIVVGAGLHSNVLRFLAPITMNKEQLAEGMDILEDAIAKFA